MKKNIVYEDEELSSKPIIIAIIVFFLFTLLIFFKPLGPDFNIMELWVTIGFMLFFCIIMFLILCLADIVKYNKFKKLQKMFILNGIKLKGTVIDSEKVVSLYVNGVPTKYKYIATIQAEDGQVFKTPYLLINSKNLLSEEVTVYKKDDEYFATDFNYDFSQKEKKTKKEEFIHIHSNDFAVPSKWQCVILLVSGMLFSIIMIWIISKAADNMTRIIISPFFVAGIGVVLQGLLPLVMIDKILAVKISKRLYMAGFLLYLFGFLIIWDYYALRDVQINLFIFSLVFWAVGIYLVIRWFFLKH